MRKLIAYYDQMPLSIEAVGDGTYLYRWDIQEDTHDGHTQYVCSEVRVFNGLTSNHVIECVLTELYGNNIEAKLINEYNSAVAGILDESYKTRYIAFLNERARIKQLIEKDFNEFVKKEKIV